MNDWTGNGNSIYKTIGASNHTDKERQREDYYATSPEAIEKLQKAVILPQYVWECACGAGHLSIALQNYGRTVYSTDLVDRGYRETGVDFLLTSQMPDFFKNDDCCIITNPPYRYATEFVEHAMAILPDKAPCFMLMKTTALESKGRWERLYKYGWLHSIYQFKERLLCAKNGDFETMKNGGGSDVSYAWFLFRRDRCLAPTIQWI